MSTQRKELLDLYDRDQRIDVEFSGVRKEASPGLVSLVRPAPGANEVLFSRLDEAAVDAVIAKRVAVSKALNQPFSWKVCEHDTPADLGTRLQVVGLQPVDPAEVMLLELQHTPEALLRSLKVDIRRVVSPHGLDDVIRVEQQVWKRDFSWLKERFILQLETPGFVSAYVVYLSGEPVYTGWTFFHRRGLFCSIWGGSTVEAYRGQGYYTTLLAARVQEAFRRGYQYMVVEAGPMSQPLVAKQGFQRLTGVMDYEWTPPMDSSDIIDVEQQP